ncbi:HAD family phosphatase [Streptomyces sp. NPDC048637]|uniref:HAD family hydrolase n=1 Tax=Streptomyces sp. NPDC048637 TaxID=3155636 RepID=UPI003424DCB4
MMSEVTVVWADFGGVLTPPVGTALRQVADAAGIPVTELLAGIRRLADRDGVDLLELLERGRITQREWGRRLTAELAPAWVPRIDLGDFGDHWYADRPLNRPLYEMLTGLRRRGFRLGMLTNSVREWEVHRAAMIPDQTVFDRVIKSHETGLRKPDPEIYRLAEEAFGVAPRECLLIDDTGINCSAAADSGWRTVHHVDNGTTLAALGELLG